MSATEQAPVEASPESTRASTRPTGSRFTQLPKTGLAWLAAALGLLYSAVALFMARSPLDGVPASVPWLIGLGGGGVVFALELVELFGKKERSFLLVVATLATAFWFLQWAILGGIGLFGQII